MKQGEHHWLLLGVLLVLLNLGAGKLVAGEMVSLYEFGADEMGYLSLPEKQPLGGVLMIPDSFGPRGVVKQRCDLMAKLGYVALVVDLYNGNVSDNPEVARRLQNRLEHDVSVQAIRAGIRLLTESPRYKTDSLILLVWGENFRAAVAAAMTETSFMADGISWAEPDALEALTDIKNRRVPLQLILREETLGDSFIPGMQRFNQLRGITSEVWRFDRSRGFLLEPESTPEAVQAWTQIIDFWKRITEKTYRAEVVEQVKPVEPAADVPRELPRSLNTRPRVKHPRLN